MSAKTAQMRVTLSTHSTKFKSFKPFCSLMSIHLLIIVIAFNRLVLKLQKIVKFVVFTTICCSIFLVLRGAEMCILREMCDQGIKS